MEESRLLVVGLGNPGTQYENTRHNVGFRVVDELASRWKIDSFQKKFKGLVTETSVSGSKVLLLKPQTFMNLSGDSVREVIHFYKIPLENSLIVISDDLDLPTGNIRIRTSGGSGGHNGLKSISEALSTEGFARVRLGIGRSMNIPTENYVLMPIPQNEKEIYQTAISTAADAVEVFVKEGIQKAMNTYNTRKSNES